MEQRVPGLLRYGLAVLLVSGILAVGACSSNTTSMNPYQQQIDELWEQYDRDPAVHDYVVMAVHLGITVEEAQRRVEVQNMFMGLESQLESGEPETFGGLWIQHEAPFCIVVAFTRDGEETIAGYVSEEQLPHLSIRNVRYSFAELRDTQNTTGMALRGMGVRFDSSTDVMDNKVVFRVEDRKVIDEAIADGTLVVPDCVEIEVGSLATLD